MAAGSLASRNNPGSPSGGNRLPPPEARRVARHPLQMQPPPWVVGLKSRAHIPIFLQLGNLGRVVVRGHSPA